MVFASEHKFKVATHATFVPGCEFQLNNRMPHISDIQGRYLAQTVPDNLYCYLASCERGVGCKRGCSMSAALAPIDLTRATGVYGWCALPNGTSKRANDTRHVHLK
jgi:hypothetical protein